MTDKEYKEYIASLDEDSLRNLKKFARFMARMIDKYGEKVMKELDENSENNNKQ